MDGNKVAQIIIITFGVILLIAIILLAIIYPLVRRKYMYRNFKYVYYKKLYEIAEKNDYLLVNNVILKENGQNIASIDHILFGDKFIYVIRDRYYVGAINGDKKDDIWLFFNKQNERIEIENPMKKNKMRIERLVDLTLLDKEFFVSIVLVNNDCVIKDNEKLNKEKNYMVNLRNLNKTIKKMEKRKDVKNMKVETVDAAARSIYINYGRGRLNQDNERN